MNRNLAYVPAIVAAALVASVAAPARADFSFNFNNASDVGLTHYDVLAPFGSGSTFTFPVLGSGNDGYRLTSGPSADPASLGVSRVGAYVADQIFTNFRESVDIVSWNSSLDLAIGLVGRVSNVGLGATNGYSLHYNSGPNSAIGRLVIERIDGEAGSPAITFVDLAPLDPNAGYRLVFTGVGATLTGQVFSMGDLGHVLSMVSLTDATYISGRMGLLTTGLTGGMNNAIDATFDNFITQSVPEPTSLALLGLGLGSVLAIVRRSRMRSVGVDGQ